MFLEDNKMKGTALNYTHFGCQNTLALPQFVEQAFLSITRLTPNDPHMGRTAPLTSKGCILYIYSTNIGTEYFNHAL